MDEIKEALIKVKDEVALTKENKLHSSIDMKYKFKKFGNFNANDYAGISLTKEARMQAYLTGFKSNGICFLCENGFSFEDAKAVVEGTKRIRVKRNSEAEENEYYCEDDDWQAPDFTEIENEMVNKLKELSDVKVPKNAKLALSMLYEKGMSLIIQMEMEKSPMGTLSIYNEFMEFIGKPENKINVNVSWLF